MTPGEVFFFESDQAEGYAARGKFHVYLGLTDHFRAPNEHSFLFVSSANYDNCFPLSQADYGFLDRDSFISCGKLVYYSDGYLQQRNLRAVGKISKAHLAALRAHLAGHEVMVEWEIQVACRVLDALAR